MSTGEGRCEERAKPVLFHGSLHELNHIDPSQTYVCRPDNLFFRSCPIRCAHYNNVPLLEAKSLERMLRNGADGLVNYRVSFLWIPVEERDHANDHLLAICEGTPIYRAERP